MKGRKLSIREELGIVEPEFVYRLFYPQVPIIVCSKAREQVAAMPANSCIPVSIKPAMIALAVNKKSRTNRVIRASGKFSLNWLNYKVPRLRAQVLDLARPTDSKDKYDDKLSLKGIPYFIENGLPVLVEADANALCRTMRRIACGDHDLYLARVIRGRASEDFLSVKYWEFKRYKPMLYLGSAENIPLTTILGS